MRSFRCESEVIYNEMNALNDRDKIMQYQGFLMGNDLGSKKGYFKSNELKLANMFL